jgi:hypothetical protein
MTGPDNFILRWARLKRESDTAQELGAASTSVETTAAQPRSDAAMDEPFDLASLPSIESIAADTDIGAFLQSGVPAELTRAALRRAWASDPAIRDFIGIAENQWDFNDPDAIPGFGPLQAAETAPAVLTQVSSKLENIPAALAEMPAPVESARSSVTYPEHSTVDQGAQATPDESGSAVSRNPSLSNEICEARAVTESVRALEEYDAFRNRRRHGSALPQ